MLKYKSLKKITALLLTLIMLCGTVVSAEDSGDKQTNITNGGEITISSLAIVNSELKVTGSYGGNQRDRLSYVVYEKNNKDRLISIGEAKARRGSFAIVFGVDKAADPDRLVIEVKASSQTEKATAEFSLSNPDFSFDEKLKSVESLLNTCEERGISTDYERVKYATAMQVNGMIEMYLRNNETEAYEFNLHKAVELLGEAEASLNAYLNGTAKPFEVNRTVTSKTDLNGQSFISKKSDGSTGPAFYLGYGHWETDDMENYKDLGINCIQYEIGVENIIKRGCPAKFWELDDADTSGAKGGYKYTMRYNSGALQLDSKGSGEVYLSQTVTVKPSTTYTFGVDFKCQAASSIWIKANGAQEAKKWVYDSSNDGAISAYKSVSNTVTTGANQTELTFTIGSHNNATELMYDNAFVRENGSQTNLLKNADFSEECTDKFAVREDNLEAVKNVFKRAEDCDVEIPLLLATHNYPAFVWDMDETVVNGDPSQFKSFINFNPTHPLIKEMLTAFINAVVPAVKDYKSLQSICLSNEPTFYSNLTPTYYLPKFRQYLQDKYTTIAALNEAYGGTSYASFDEVNMPTQRTNIPYYNDYRLFNETIMTEYHKTLADAVRAIDSSIPLHTKHMTAMNAIGNSSNRIESGINHEKLAKFLEINGCDAWAYYGETKDTVLSKTMWYDYMTSVNNAPVVNTEDHILRDWAGETNSVPIRSEAQYNMNMADLWQGAIHGRGGSVVWFWDKKHNTGKGSYYYNANLTRRADYIAGIGKTALDLNRLSGEVTALQQAKRRVAVLYSDSTLAQNQYSLNAGYIAYTKAAAHGEKTFFLTEEEPQLLNSNKDLKLLVVPCCNYMKAATLQEIKKFIDGGGSVLMLNAGDKQWLDENGKPHNSELLESVTSRSASASFSSASGMYTYDANGAVSAALDTALNALEPGDVRLSATGGNVEWLQAQYGQKRVINICNHGTEDAQITLTVPEGYNDAVDLISGTVVGSTFTAKPNVPMLLGLQGDSDIKFLNAAGEEVNHISGSSMISSAACYDAKPGTQAVHIAAVYQEDCLVKVFTNTVTADVGGTVKSRLEFNIDSSIDLSKCRVKAFLFDSLENIEPLLPSKEIEQQ